MENLPTFIYLIMILYCIVHLIAERFGYRGR